MSQLIQIGFGRDEASYQAICDWLEPQGLVLQEVAVARQVAGVYRGGGADDRPIWARCKSGLAVAANGVTVAAGVVTLFAMFSDEPPKEVDNQILVEGAVALVEKLNDIDCGRDVTLTLKSNKDESVLTITGRSSPADVVAFCLDQIETPAP